jgi:hypothetical protein
MTNEYMKNCLTSLIIKKMKIKTTLRLHLTPIRMAVIKGTTNVGKDVGDKESLYTVRM